MTELPKLPLLVGTETTMANQHVYRFSDGRNLWVEMGDVFVHKDGGITVIKNPKTITDGRGQQYSELDMIYHLNGATDFYKDSYVRDAVAGSSTKYIIIGSIALFMWIWLTK